MDFIDVIKTRKSIRDFSNKPISDKILNEILISGQLAPSCQNRQCWRYLVVKDKNLINKLALHSGLIGKVNFFIKNAPVIIVATADPQNSCYLNDQHYYLVDVGISFQQMMLTAWNFGIGSCWLAAFNEQKVKFILDIPDSYKVVALSPFGYPKDEKSLYSKVVSTFAKSKKRKSLEEIIMPDKWKS